MKSKIKLIIIAGVIFILSFLIWSLPIKYKGTAPTPVTGDQILARNFYLTGKYTLTDNQGIFLNTAKIKNEGSSLKPPNWLTPYIYSQIYKIFGYSESLTRIICLLLFSLTNLLLFLFLTKVFNLKIGLLFSLLMMVTPVIWQNALIPVFYEWALLFFACGFILYWLAERSPVYLFLTGLFFSLAILTRNAFLIIVGIFFLYELIANKSLKRLIIFGLPLVLFVILPLFYSYFSRGQSVYLDKNYYGSYSHCFPDPYTYFYARDEFAKNALETMKNDPDVLYCLQDYGYQVNKWRYPIDLLKSSWFYLRGLFRLTTFGGPVAILLAFLGLFELKRKKPAMLNLFYLWFILLFIALVLIISSNWNHLLELFIPLLLLISLGAMAVYELIKDQFLNLKPIKKFLAIVIICSLFFSYFINADKWMFHEIYETSSLKQVTRFSEAINQSNLTADDVVALEAPAIESINYYTNKNLIKFSTPTIKKLLSENKLEQAFIQFGVTKIIGYEANLSQEITAKTGVKEILINEK